MSTDTSRWNLSALAIRHRTLVVFAMIAFAIAGLNAFSHLGRAEDPDFTFKVMVVSASWPGATARETELLVTDPLEKIIQQVPHFDKVTSYSRPGEAVLMINLRDDTPKKDVPEAWYQIRKRITDHRGVLPQGVLGPRFNDEFGDTYGTIYAFTADGFSDTEVRRIVDDVRQRILRVKDVAKAEMIGDRPERLFIEISQERLATLGVTTAQLIDAVQKQIAVTASGIFETPSDRVALRLKDRADTVEAMADLPIVANGRTLRVGDLGKVQRGYEDPRTFSMRVGGKPAIGLTISMADGGNVQTLGEGLKAELERIKRDLPAGIDVIQVADQPAVVEKSMEEFVHSLGEALAIVLAVSFISLGLRTGIVVALSVPLVLAITFVFMEIFGINLHRISLGALIIALGLLVDDAIIAVEMMQVKLEEGLGRLEAASFAYRAAAFPMLTGTLVTAAGFIPVGFAKSTAGEYTGAIFSVVTIALLVSWVTAVIFTPYLGYKLLPANTHTGPKRDLCDTRLYRSLRRVLDICVAHPRRVIWATVGAFALALAGFALVPQQFFPSASRPELVMDLRLAGGSSFAAADAAAKRLETHLAKDPDVASYVVYTGAGSPRFYLPLNVELKNAGFAQAVVTTKDNVARERVLTRFRALMDTDFTELSARISRLENGPPVGFPVQFRVLGKDPQQIRQIAEQVREVVRANPHTRDVNFDWHEMSKSVEMDIDRARARALGLAPSDVAKTMDTFLNGVTIGEVRERNDLIPVVARAIPEERRAIDDIGSASIFVSDPVTGVKKTLSLDQVANLKPTFEEPVLWRRNRDTMMVVRAEVGDATQPPVVSQQIDKALGEIRSKLPDGYRVEMAGAIEESAKSNVAIGAVVPVMVLAMLAILMVQLQSFSRLALVLATAPLGLIGVTISLLLFRQPFGFVALLGVIALAGMIMRNSVILVDQIDQGVAAGEPPLRAIVNATIHRARPVVLTAAAAILAMIPLARTDFWGPMAVAIMGGLAVATVLTLIVLPALYARFLAGSATPTLAVMAKAAE